MLSFLTCLRVKAVSMFSASHAYPRPGRVTAGQPIGGA